MKKLLVCSDSHGNDAALRAAAALEKPDLLLFLGDGAPDLDALRAAFPALDVRAVRGTCDWASAAPELRVLQVEQLRVFMTHGHRYRVKDDPGLMNLRYAALERGAALALFGHTHWPSLDRWEGLTVLNPGAMENGCYATVTVDGETLTAQLRKLAERE
ncbi:MAG: YfcE family phosphodiesterase [Oscillospiraceae bacterium]|nr:YfcE family phosphodiesterase [Oscillospiraceae bacterium]